METFKGNMNTAQEIMGIMAEIHSYGANDYEMSALQEILGNYHAKKYSDAEALEKARAVRDSKQAYH